MIGSVQPAQRHENPILKSTLDEATQQQMRGAFEGLSDAPTQSETPALPPVRQKWLGIPVDEVSGTATEIAAQIPRFSRMPFALRSNGHVTNENPYLDMIVREPLNGSGARVPVGIVSKSYTLLQHSTVFDRTLDAIKAAGVELDSVVVDLIMTEHGERMELQFLFPDEYSMLPNDGEPIALQLRCINSVDGSHVFDATLGWFRFICSNGLMIGTVKSRYKKAHTQDLDITKIREFLVAGIAGATLDRVRINRWQGTVIREEILEKWVNKPLRETWGVKAATRAYHIARSGYDAELTLPFEKAPPSERTIRRRAKVPGADFDSLNAYGVSQALSWLAKERRELHEYLARERQVSPLIQRLISLN